MCFHDSDFCGSKMMQLGGTISAPLSWKPEQHSVKLWKLNHMKQVLRID